MLDGNSFLWSLYRFYTFSVTSIWYEYKSNEYLFTFKRIIILILIFLFFPLLMAWNHIGFFLDDLFFPKWRIQKIIQPIFLVGNARSGTTWLHRLLISLLDHKRLTTLRTWEIFFAPSVTWRMFFYSIYRFDTVFGSPLYRFICFLETSCIPKSSMHEVGLQLAEEDEWLMLHISSAQLMCFFFPCGGAVLGPLISFDSISSANANSLSLSEKCRIYQYYKECIQRHLYFQSLLDHLSSPIFLSKNPAFTLRISTLYRTFPDCRVVCLLRDPVDSIPSMVSYIGTV